MAHSLPVKVRRTEFASSDPDELREVIDRGFGSRLQLAIPRRSRFATRYQEAYGVRPSQTLRQD